MSALLALSIRQPWAWLIVHAGKDVENRRWWTNYRGDFLIHAAKGMTRAEYADCQESIGSIRLPTAESLERGGIVGVADLYKCVRACDSRWFSGPFGFMLRNVRPLPFHACRGDLKFFMPKESP